MLYTGAGVGVGLAIAAGVATAGIAFVVVAAVVGVIGLTVALSKSYRENKQERELKQKKETLQHECVEQQKTLLENIKRQYVHLEADLLQCNPDDDKQKLTLKKNAIRLLATVKGMKKLEVSDENEIIDLTKHLNNFIEDPKLKEIEPKENRASVLKNEDQRERFAKPEIISSVV